MIALPTPPPSPQAVRVSDFEFETDLDFVINQERKPGQSFAFNLPFNDWHGLRRTQIHSLIPITSSLYLLSDSTTSLRNVLDHCLDRAGKAISDAHNTFPNEFRALRPLLGDEFARGMEKEFEREKTGGCKRGLWWFFLWARERVRKGSKCHKISYEAFVAEMIVLPLLESILVALKKPMVDAVEVEKLVFELEKAVQWVGSEVRVELANSIDDASRVAQVQGVVDRYEKHALYGEIPPFLLLHPYPPPAPAPFIVHHSHQHSIPYAKVKSYLKEAKQLCVEFPVFFPCFFIFLALLAAVLFLSSSNSVVHYLGLLTYLFFACMPVFHLWLLFVYGDGEEMEEGDTRRAARKLD